MHSLSGEVRNEIRVERTHRASALAIATDERRHLIFHSLLKSLSLSRNHFNALTARGFDPRTIEENQYVSTPTEKRGNVIAADLCRFGVEGVPGFYKVGDTWRLVQFHPGILIPVRNERRQIVGIQIRHDESERSRPKYMWLSSAGRGCGVSSGAPLHWARFDLLPYLTEALLTEGALKSDLIARFLAVPVIAAPGVGLFPKNFGTKLKTLYPNLTVIIAFDADWREKPHVKAALIALQRQLTTAGVEWKVRCWASEYKGYDDFLFDHSRRGVVA